MINRAIVLLVSLLQQPSRRTASCQNPPTPLSQRPICCPLSQKKKVTRLEQPASAAISCSLGNYPTCGATNRHRVSLYANRSIFPRTNVERPFYLFIYF